MREAVERTRGYSPMGGAGTGGEELLVDGRILY